jgi:hypothetical protein
MIQQSQDLGFALEARHAVGIGRQRLRQNLDGHFSVELRIRRAPHLAHAAFTELGGNPVMG